MCKQFYVSPFIEMEANYKFLNKMFEDQININIDLFDKNNAKFLLLLNMENLLNLILKICLNLFLIIHY